MIALAISLIKSVGKLGSREMWERSMKGFLTLIRRTTPSSFTYICEKNGHSLTDKVIYGSHTCSAALIMSMYLSFG